MIIEMPTLKQYLNTFKMREGPLRKCKEVERLLAKKQMTIQDACRIIGVSTTTYCRYKKARRKPGKGTTENLNKRPESV
jgi:ACT domain-containing protein